MLFQEVMEWTHPSDYETACLLYIYRFLETKGENIDHLFR